MDVAALIAWLATAAGGFYMLGTWIARGGVRQQQTGGSRFPAPVIFGHFVLAAIGLVVWIAYLVADTTALAWTAFALLLPVALLGFVMLARWIPVYRSRTVAPAHAGPSGSPVGAGTGAGTGSGPGTEHVAPAERAFPLVVVLGHGVLAVVTLVLVLLGALNAGS